MSKQADNDIGWRYYIQGLDDELAHIEDTLCTESFAFGIEHVVDDCTCPGKQCPDCGQTKCYGAFHRDRRAKAGLRIYCKLCSNTRTKAYEEANPEKRRQQNTATKRKHYEANREDVIKRNNAYSRQHPERSQLYRVIYDKAHPERRKVYWQANRQKLNESRNAWRHANPEKDTTYYENRRTRKMQAEGSFTSEEWKALKIRYNYACLCCGKSEPDVRLTADHIVPLSKGGDNSIENIQPLCRSCNSVKGVQIIDYRRHRHA